MADAQQLQQHEAMVEVHANNVTLGGAMRHKGDVFPATDLPEAIYAYVEQGRIANVSLIPFDPERVVSGSTDITVGYYPNGEPILVPADRRAGRGSIIEATPRQPVNAFSAPTVKDHVAAEKLGMEPVAGLAELHARLEQLERQVAHGMTEGGSAERVNVTEVAGLDAAVSDATVARTAIDEDLDRQAEGNASASRATSESAGLPVEGEEPPNSGDEARSERTPAPKRAAPSSKAQAQQARPKGANGRFQKQAPKAPASNAPSKTPEGNAPEGAGPESGGQGPQG